MSKQELFHTSPLESEHYIVSDVDHKLIEQFKPQYIARGGEHIVYDIPDHPDIVAKAAKESVATLIKNNVEQGNPPDYLGNDERERAERFLQEEASRFKQLRQYFGKEHTLSQKKYLLKLPVTPQILSDLFEGNPPALPTEAWGMIVIQKRSKALQNTDHLTVVAGYAERQENVNQEAYQTQTEQLFVNPHEEAEFDQVEFLGVQGNHNELPTLVQNSNESDELKNSLRDFVQKAVRYTSETGETLDLAGSDNVAVYQQDGKWNYELLDALYPGTKDMVPRTQQALRKLAAGEEIDDGNRNVLMNTINYVRTINGLAKSLGTKHYIDIVPPEAKQAKINYWAEIQKHLKKKPNDEQ